MSHGRDSLFRQFVGLNLALGVLVATSPAWAWGDLGHKIICQIAFQELNDTARNEVSRLIALDGTFDSFTDACTWPDHPRKRAEEHFVNVPRSLQTITTTGCHGVPKCLFTAIPADLEVLRTSNDDAAKLASLKFLGHWIGDIHQPLHISFADDRGGNFIRESGPCVNSLHTVRDTCIIEKKLGTDPQTIARDLLDGLPDSDRAAWVAVPIAGWRTSPSRSRGGSRCSIASGSGRNASISRGTRSSQKARTRRWSSWMPHIWNSTSHSSGIG
jgi:hypothetical protein